MFLWTGVYLFWCLFSFREEEFDDYFQDLFLWDVAMWLKACWSMQSCYDLWSVALMAASVSRIDKAGVKQGACTLKMVRKHSRSRAELSIAWGREVCFRCLFFFERRLEASAICHAAKCQHLVKKACSVVSLSKNKHMSQCENSVASSR